MKKYDTSFTVAFFKAVFAWVLLGLIGTSSLRAQTPLNDSNFNIARDLWFSDQAAAIATYGHIKDWNVTGVTNMNQAFRNKTTFDDNISAWDVSNVTTMREMFEGADAFNQDIGDWNTSSVTIMYEMFRNTNSFNQDIGDWDTSSVTNMQSVFNLAPAFNQDVSDWNVSANVIFINMFVGANALSNAHKRPDPFLLLFQS